MKIVYMGTSEFAVPALKELIKNGYEVDLVVTQPDRRGNRGKIQISPIKEVALEHGLKISQPLRIRKDEDFMLMFEDLEPDMIVVASFGQILPKRVLDIPRYGCFNIHGSLLPKYRGAAPMQFAIADGISNTGVTLMKMDEGLDTGDIVSTKEISLAGKDIFDLTDELSKAGARLLIEEIPNIISGKAIYRKQDDKDASFTRLLKKSDGETDFRDDAKIEMNKLLAFRKWPVLHSYLDGKSYKFFDAEIVNSSCDADKFGMVIDINDDNFIIKCGKNALAIKELQLEGKKRMKAKDFLRGSKIKIGDRFTKKKD